MPTDLEIARSIELAPIEEFIDGIGVKVPEVSNVHAAHCAVGVACA